MKKNLKWLLLGFSLVVQVADSIIFNVDKSSLIKVENIVPNQIKF